MNWENVIIKKKQTLHYDIETNSSIKATQQNLMQSHDATEAKHLQEYFIDQERENKNVYIYCIIVCIVLYLTEQRLFAFIYLCF